MNTELWKDRWHDLRDRLTHMWGKSSEDLEREHRQAMEELQEKHGEEEDTKHHVDDIAGSE